MKTFLEDRLNKETLQQFYPLPESFARRTRHTLNTLETNKEIPMKRKLSFAFVLLMVVLLAAGGYALTRYGVLDFLFQTPSRDQVEQLTPLTQKLNLNKTVNNISLKIDSAFYDGESFALDWTIQNLDLNNPRYITISRFEMGGQKLSLDGTDGFNDQWLPGYFARDGIMQDGELSLLPLDKLKGDKQKVVMELMIVTPTKPLFYLEEMPEDLDDLLQETFISEQNKVGEQKLKEGFIVMAEDNFFIPFPKDEENDSGFARVIGPIENILKPGDYTKEFLSLEFDMDISPARQAHQELSPQAEYVFDWMSLRYIKAVKTPTGVYLVAEIKPLPGQEKAFEGMINHGEWKMSDGEGVALDIWPLESECCGQEFPDGSFGRICVISLPIAQKDMPEEVSLTFYPENGSKPLISPVKIR